MASLRKKVKDLKLGAQKRRQDFDPEDDPFSKQEASEDETDSEDTEDENPGREHYETVSKSKLRKPEKTILNERKYGGQAVSRNKIFQDNDDLDMLAPEEDEDEDPFARKERDIESSESEENDENLEGDPLDGGEIDEEVDNDDEIDSDEAFEEGEEADFRKKGFVFRGSGQDLETLPTGGDESEHVEDQSGGESSVSGEDLSDLDMEDLEDDEAVDRYDSATDLSPEDDDDEGDESEDENEDEISARPRPSTIKLTGNTDREKLKALIADDTATLASTLSASLSADAKKGAAVKQQYQTFDRLLDARIKLQKGLTAYGDLLLKSSTMTDQDAQVALQRAEEAALKLFSTIESIRHSILDSTYSSTGKENSAQASRKRKRPSPATTSTSTSELWARLSTLESHSVPNRRQVLDKWASKTRSSGPSSSSVSSRLTSTQTSQDSRPPLLSTVLTTYLNTETPKLLPAPDETYSDAQFYQSLLRDLINSRSSTSNSTNQFAVPAPPLLKLHPSGNTARSGRDRVDTKASKGRKIRYTVHEKLENFMAGEGRGNAVGQWNDGAVREFFASLLGQSGLLGEEEDADVDEGMGVDGNGEALRLFG